MPTFDFKQLDVFSSVSLKGNPLAVVLGADSLSDQQMATLPSGQTSVKPRFC